MAPAERSSDRALKWLLVERPQRFEFFEAVRLLERLLPDRARVGGDAEPRHEVARFRSRVALGFPNGDVWRIELPGAPDPSDRRSDDRREGEPGAPARVDVQFMGLATPSSFGSLPLPYALLLLEEARERRHAFHDFIDIFTHRFVSLFYRAWRKSRLAVSADGTQESHFERALLALIGLGTPSLRDRLPLPDTELLSRAGLLLRRPAPALAIESLIASYFGVPARVEPFRPVRFELEPEDRTRIGRANARLGQDCVLGSAVVLRDARFRVCLGPLGRDDYERFLPHGDGHLALCRLIRFAVQADLEFEVQLVLRASDVPRLRLGREPRPTRLGRSTWLLARPSTRDRGDSVRMPPPDLVPSQAENASGSRPTSLALAG